MEVKSEAAPGGARLAPVRGAAGAEKIIQDGLDLLARELKRPLLELRQLALGLDNLESENESSRQTMVQITEQAMHRVDSLTKVRALKNGDYELGPVAVRAVCDDVVRELSNLFAHQSGEMTIRYSNRSRLVRANEELLKDVVYNFLLDATHYNADGMKTELLVHEVSHRVEISVRDFGPALPMDVWREVKNNLLAPRDIVMRPSSSALGLYAASKFSEYMGAEVGAIRHRDGTSFYVRLPIVEQLTMLGQI